MNMLVIVHHNLQGLTDLICLLLAMTEHKCNQQQFITLFCLWIRLFEHEQIGLKCILKSSLHFNLTDFWARSRSQHKIQIWTDTQHLTVRVNSATPDKTIIKQGGLDWAVLYVPANTV